MLSTAPFDDKAAAPERQPRQPRQPRRPHLATATYAAPRRDTSDQPQPRPGDERPLTFDDVARIGDTKADEDSDTDGQSSTKGTGSAG
jgi:hypothetical protein